MLRWSVPAGLILLAAACAYDAGPDSEGGFQGFVDDMEGEGDDSPLDAGPDAESVPEDEVVADEDADEPEAADDVKEPEPVDEAEDALCLGSCAYLYGCMFQICDASILGPIDDLVEACRESCLSTGFEDFGDYTEFSCEAINATLCSEIPDFVDSCACDLPDKDIGAACQADEDCDGGEGFCIQEYEGGYCSGQCEFRYDCGLGAQCVTVQGDAICLATCDPVLLGIDCRGSYGCWSLPDENFEVAYCLPTCMEDTDCFPGQSCVEGSCL